MSALATTLDRPSRELDAPGALIEDGRWRYRVEPFRQAFLESSIDGEELDRRCGWSSSYHRRVLGLRADVSTRHGRGGTTKRYRSVRTELSYEHAVALCRALDLDFVEWGV